MYLLVITMVAPDHRDIGINHNLLARRLDAHVSNGSGRRPNKDDSLLLALFSKFNILGEKSVARVNRLSTLSFWINSLRLKTKGGNLSL